MAERAIAGEAFAETAVCSDKEGGEGGGGETLNGREEGKGEEVFA